MPLSARAACISKTKEPGARFGSRPCLVGEDGFASRALKNTPPDYFSPPVGGTCCSHLTLSATKQKPRRDTAGFSFCLRTIKKIFLRFWLMTSSPRKRRLIRCSRLIRRHFNIIFIYNAYLIIYSVHKHRHSCWCLYIYISKFIIIYIIYSMDMSVKF